MAEDTESPLAKVLGVDPDAVPREQPQRGSGATSPGAAPAVPPMTTSTPPSDERLPFLSRAWNATRDVGAGIVRDLTPTINIPGTAPAAPPAALTTPPGVSTEVYSPGAAGVVRGVKDVALSKPVLAAIDAAENVTGTDLAARARKYNEEDRKQFDEQYGNSNWASAGRMGGQFLATAPVLGPLGKVVQAGAKFVPGLGWLTGATRATGLVPRAAQLASEGAITGAEAGALTSGQSDESLGSQVLQGAIGGAVLNPVVGAIPAGIRAVTGLAGGIDPAVARLAQLAQEKLGLTIPVTKFSQNPTMRMLSDQFSKLPFSGAFSKDLALRREAQAVLAREAGETADNFGPEVMRKAQERISQGFTDFANNAGQIHGGAPLLTDIADVGTQAQNIPLPKDELAIVLKQVKNIRDEFFGPGKTGSVSPEQWLALTAKDGNLEKAYRASSGAAKPYIAQLIEALQDRLNASVAPEARDAVARLRYQHRVVKTVEGNMSPTGDISFDKLESAARRASQKFDKGGYKYDYNDDPNNVLNTLVRTGKQFLGGLPDSGTAARTLAMGNLPQMLSGLGTAVATAPVTAWMRTPFVQANALATSLDQSPRHLLGRWLHAGLPTTERMRIPASLLGVGLREEARRPEQDQ